MICEQLTNQYKYENNQSILPDDHLGNYLGQ